MAETKINLAALYAALDAARVSRDISWRQMAREVGVSPSTFSRMGNHQKPDVDAFLKMVSWLRVPAERFMIQSGEADDREQPDLMVEFVPLLRARKDLNSEDKKYLEELIGSAMRRFADERGRRDA
ncbi:transcriptional regulator [Actinomadura craniellae]|uniref:Transcriptional regulator n=1 Tax=Actinomadura craniellae TaxID=2231787 RepID=A0A365H7S9_9ACTN|nr:helix-turn-helix transcriptional regulator [Actinomadura craniellae]RAY15026.1 transcriptional regulator [Actinomadura craniellae]